MTEVAKADEIIQQAAVIVAVKPNGDVVVLKNRDGDMDGCGGLASLVETVNPLYLGFILGTAQREARKQYRVETHSSGDGPGKPGGNAA